MTHKSLITSLIVSGWLALVLVGGCSIKTRALLFDGVDKEPPPPTTRVRRDLLAEIETLKRDLADAQKALETAKAKQQVKTADAPLPTELAKSWVELSELLPKHRSGQVDWGAALQAGTIRPQAGLDPTVLAYAEFNLDITLDRTKSPTMAARGLSAVKFSHAAHSQWLICDNCHTKGFQINNNGTDNILKHDYCDNCHGTVAFAMANLDTCDRCHLRLP